MNTVLLDFEARVEEINKYFLFLEELIHETTKLVVLDECGEQRIIVIDPELAKTLKANGFLLLYNLIESSMKNAIEAIYDELKSNQISFNAVRVELKKVVIQNFKNRSPENIYLNIRDISLDFITIGFNSQELFSGNIDRDEISKTAKKYGFSCDTDYSKTKHGQSLRQIKVNRNDLAHGNKSFSEVGRNTTIENILEFKKEVIEYIGQILTNIKTYLDAREYLDSSYTTTN